MSRYTHKITEGLVAFGLDHMTGYFLQVFNYKGDMVMEMESDPFLKDQKKTHRVEIADYLHNCGIADGMAERIKLDMEI